MIFWGTYRFACSKCQVGHRNASCDHLSRPLIELKGKGRPVSQCSFCRDKRRAGQGHAHHKCICGSLSSSISKKRMEAYFETGIVMVFEGENAESAHQKLQKEREITVTIQKKKTQSPDDLHMNFVFQTAKFFEEVVEVDMMKILANPCQCHMGGPCICSELPAQPRNKSRKETPTQLANIAPSLASSSPSSSAVRPATEAIHSVAPTGFYSNPQAFDAAPSKSPGFDFNLQQDLSSRVFSDAMSHPSMLPAQEMPSTFHGQYPMVTSHDRTALEALFQLRDGASIYSPAGLGSTLGFQAPLPSPAPVIDASGIVNPSLLAPFPMMKPSTLDMLPYITAAPVDPVREMAYNARMANGQPQAGFGNPLPPVQGDHLPKRSCCSSKSKKSPAPSKPQSAKATSGCCGSKPKPDERVRSGIASPQTDSCCESGRSEKASLGQAHSRGGCAGCESNGGCQCASSAGGCRCSSVESTEYSSSIEDNGHEWYDNRKWVEIPHADPSSSAAPSPAHTKSTGCCGGSGSGDGGGSCGGRSREQTDRLAYAMAHPALQGSVVGQHQHQLQLQLPVVDSYASQAPTEPGAGEYVSTPPASGPASFCASKLPSAQRLEALVALNTIVQEEIARATCACGCDRQGGVCRNCTK
ncbi:uncharacterized protein BJ171DRAFT_509722 [Polychytrium aggregatum]|uniref:uncharacterized protein n=1 Tax=Polychytrium aggregatum TaxID=110093 RepID=UPI0022FF41E5|nr:uncharacterized protein BJ171DRAFT_509722 [Polychytrium aggregatum]KAI9203474.1 hypothetical protein BJ171DRAFT_509722 [Polychytrium aggregatum]